VRGATITEFFLAYVYSNTDNIQANLHYLDYTRLKKSTEAEKAAAERKEEPRKTEPKIEESKSSDDQDDDDDDDSWKEFLKSLDDH